MDSGASWSVEVRVLRWRKRRVWARRRRLDFAAKSISFEKSSLNKMKLDPFGLGKNRRQERKIVGMHKTGLDRESGPDRNFSGLGGFGSEFFDPGPVPGSLFYFSGSDFGPGQVQTRKNTIPESFFLQNFGFRSGSSGWAP